MTSLRSRASNDSFTHPAPLGEDLGKLVTPRIVLATARRVLIQLRGDRRTVGMLLVVPSVLLALTHEMFDSQPRFNAVALSLLGIFPFTLMFLVTSVAMLRERTGGTLERLLTTPMSKLDLLLGYGLAFALAATAQAMVTCLVAYWLLDLYTPGDPLVVLAVAVAGAVLGTAIGLLTSAFATSEFQAVQFMPVVVLPQVLIGGLFIPREQMTDWLETVSDVLPMSYSIDAMDEVGSRSMITGDLLRDVTVVALSAILALTLAACTLRRRTGGISDSARRATLGIVAALLVVATSVAGWQMVDIYRYVTTDNAQVNGDPIPIVATAAGTIFDWQAVDGSYVRKHQAIGRIELRGAFGRARKVLRAPAEGTIAQSDVVSGTFVEAGSRLAVAYDLSDIYVTAWIDETDIADVHVGQPVEVILDAASGPIAGVVLNTRVATATLFEANPQANTTAVFERRSQIIPVKISLTDQPTVRLVPGMSATVKIRKTD